jgi:hypothetical protein
MNDFQVLFSVRSCKIYQMELLVLVAESLVLQQLTPVVVNTLYKDHGQGHVVKMDSGQAKNQPARVSYR